MESWPGAAKSSLVQDERVKYRWDEKEEIFTLSTSWTVTEFGPSDTTSVHPL